MQRKENFSFYGALERMLDGHVCAYYSIRRRRNGAVTIACYFRIRRGAIEKKSNQSGNWRQVRFDINRALSLEWFSSEEWDKK